MNVRILAVLILVVSVVAAACGGSSKATPTATPVPSQTSTPVPSATAEPATEAFVPFTPVEEVLTPPPDIDTSGWLTYRDEVNGFELKYPPAASIERNITDFRTDSAALGTRLSFPVALGMELQSKIGFVSVGQMPMVDCIPRREGRDLRLIRAQHADFWSYGGVNGAAMHQFRTMFYVTGQGTTCITLEAILTSVSPSAFRTPIPTYDRETECNTFLAILATFRWLN